MAIVYIEGSFQIYHLNIKTETELNEFIKNMINSIKKLNSNLVFDNDVEITVEERAGKFHNENQEISISS